MLKIQGAFLLIWRAAPGLAIARMIILILQGLLPLAFLYLTKFLIDTLAYSVNLSNKTAIFDDVIFFLVLVAIITIATTICASLNEIINSAQSQSIVDYVEATLYRKAIEIDLEYYENSHYHDILQRAQREAPHRPNQILLHTTAMIQSAISMTAMVGLLFSLNWIIALILFATSVPAMLVRFKYSGIMYRWHRKKTEVQRKTTYFGHLLCTDIFAKEVRLFNVGSVFIKRFLKLRRQLYQEKLHLISNKSLANLAVQIFSGLMVLSAYGFVINQTIQGVLKIGDLVIYHQAIQRGQQSLTLLVTNISFLNEDSLFLANLYEFLALKPKIIESSNPQPFPQKIRYGITLKDVSFRYPGTSRIALKNISLTIEPGKTIALVGENGSGKTTLIKLLCRLYDISSGSITIDGIDIRDIATADLYRQISVVFQDFARYNLSAQDNIWLGNIALSPNDEKVLNAARRSGADEVIKSLDKSYQTILGKQFGEGEELSGGQWQKIALARAFLRDSQVIILDEPTSAMDPKAEEKVFRKFRELIENQAAILVTHRLSTVTMADCIYVMSCGSIVESGTHQELMKLGGIYADLFETQAKNYRFKS